MVSLWLPYLPEIKYAKISTSSSTGIQYWFIRKLLALYNSCTNSPIMPYLKNFTSCYILLRATVLHKLPYRLKSIRGMVPEWPLSHQADYLDRSSWITKWLSRRLVYTLITLLAAKLDNSSIQLADYLDLKYTLFRDSLLIWWYRVSGSRPTHILCSELDYLIWEVWVLVWSKLLFLNKR